MDLRGGITNEDPKVSHSIYSRSFWPWRKEQQRNLTSSGPDLRDMMDLLALSLVCLLKIKRSWGSRHAAHHSSRLSVSMFLFLSLITGHRTLVSHRRRRSWTIVTMMNASSSSIELLNVLITRGILSLTLSVWQSKVSQYFSSPLLLVISDSMLFTPLSLFAF